MSLALRPYQVALVEQARTLMRQGTRRLILQAPTGAGKTILTAFMLKTAAEKGMRAIFCVHRRELLKQSLTAFDRVGLGVGIIAAGFYPTPGFPVQVASIQSLGRRLATLRTPQLLIFDECHHQAAAGWAKVAQAFPQAFQIGLTATPERLDGKGLDAYFDALLCGPSVAELTAQGYLAPYKLYAPAAIATEGVHQQAGDFNRHELSAVADKPTITGEAVAHYQRLAPGKRALVRCVSIRHSQHVAAQFRAAGILAAHVDGDTPLEERDQAFQDFAAGRLTVMTQVDLVNEGLDIAGIECAIDLRPTMSLTLWLQFCGRALRYAPNKTALLLDAAGNCLRHGLPDEARTWTLAGRDRAAGSRDPALSVRLCPVCFAAARPGLPACPHCGAAYAEKPREVEQREGDLQEVDPSVLRRLRKIEQGRADTYEDLVALGIARKYKSPQAWARLIIQARQRKRASLSAV